MNILQQGCIKLIKGDNKSNLKYNHISQYYCFYCNCTVNCFDKKCSIVEIL